MKQIVCECGRVAEVRRRSNGQKLRYKYCAACGTSLGGIESAKILERQERDDIGVFGEFYDKSKNTSGGAEKAPAAVSSDWVPDAETMPEILENSEIGDSKNLENSEMEKPVNFGKMAVIGVSVVGLAFLGFGVRENWKNISGGSV